MFHGENRKIRPEERREPRRCAGKEQGVNDQVDDDERERRDEQAADGLDALVDTAVQHVHCSTEHAERECILQPPVDEPHFEFRQRVVAESCEHRERCGERDVANDYDVIGRRDNHRENEQAADAFSPALTPD